MSPIWIMPDGSRWNIPDCEVAAPDGTDSSQRVAATSPVAPDSTRQFLREIGRRGGLARAARHSREEKAAWGRIRHNKSNRS